MCGRSSPGAHLSEDDLRHVVDLENRLVVQVVGAGDKTAADHPRRTREEHLHVNTRTNRRRRDNGEEQRAYHVTRTGEADEDLADTVDPEDAGGLPPVRRSGRAPSAGSLRLP